VTKVAVQLGQSSYDALIGPGILERLGELSVRHSLGPRCAVISDANVAPLFTVPVIESLSAAGIAAELITIPPGEKSKTIGQASALCEQLSDAGFDRSSFLVSLGGGVVSDLVGFVASIYLRGIPYVAVPTTLLAQVDSCVGGKTAVNSAAGNNLIGTLHHPALVLADTETLRSLPERIWNEGFAEAIKHGIIRDAGLFDSIPLIRREDPAEFIERNIAIKAAIVAKDEREETGVRALLNFGHTIGHALEHAAGYGNLLHGEAVSLGMVAAARISVRRAGLSLGECDRIIAALRRRQLPTALADDFPREKIFPAILRDKKFENGRIRFVVAHAIGRASLSEEVTLDDLRTAVAEL
jgi:3-dehydroquinate synthase